MDDGDDDLSPREIQNIIVESVGPEVGFNPDMLDTSRRVSHAAIVMKRAESRDRSRALMIVVDGAFEGAHRDFVVDAVESVDAEFEGGDGARPSEMIADFIDAGVMEGWTEVMSNRGGWIARPLVPMVGHVLTRPIRDALGDMDVPFLPRSATHVAFPESGRDEVRVMESVRDRLEGEPASIDDDETESVPVSDLIGPLVANDGDDLVRPGDEEFDSPESLRRM